MFAQKMLAFVVARMWLNKVILLQRFGYTHMTTITILDGGLGRELQRIGAPFSQPLWSAQALIESPQHVKQAHQNFVDAGARVITVNSYACVPFHLGEALYAEQGVTLAAKAAQIAYEVAEESADELLVAGSIPPVQGSYRPDLFDADAAYQIASELLQAQEKYVDIWLAETVSSLAELAVLTKVFEQTDKPYIISFSLADDLAQPARLRSGELVSDAAKALIDTEAAGLFFNCSIPEVIEQGIREVNAVLEGTDRELTIGAYANSFSAIKPGHLANGALQETRYFSPKEYLEYAKIWQQLGATFIGGCCGIEPSHIEALTAWANESNREDEAALSQGKDTEQSAPTWWSLVA